MCTFGLQYWPKSISATVWLFRKLNLVMILKKIPWISKTHFADSTILIFFTNRGMNYFLSTEHFEKLKALFKQHRLQYAVITPKSWNLCFQFLSVCVCLSICLLATGNCFLSNHFFGSGNHETWVNMCLFWYSNQFLLLLLQIIGAYLCRFIHYLILVDTC